jgi:hypothetical protein
MTCHLKDLIFDCLSFTEVLITLLFTTDDEAPVVLLFDQTQSKNLKFFKIYCEKLLSILPWQLNCS